jgi:O-antigen/teichoic acid export membrane protein
MGYLKTTLSGISWSVGQRWIVRGLTILRLAILARILSPAQFGVFGVATIVLGFLETFTETSINFFLVQEKKEIDHYINTAWIISIIRGLVIGLIILTFSGPISDFFHSDESLTVLRFMALVPIIRGFINPSVAKLQKNLLFKNEFIYKTLLFTVDSVVSILFSVITRNASGLVWGMLASAVFEVSLSYLLFRPKPAFLWNRNIAKEIISRGKWITAAGIFNYFYQNADNLVVGRLLGESSLGIYSSAYKLSSLPVSEVSDVIARVTFPVYVKISHDLSRLKSAFIKSSLVISLISVFMGLFIYIFAAPIVAIVLGSAWTEAIPVLRVLSVYGVTKSITNTIYPIFLATEKQNYITYINLASCLGLGLTILPFVSRWGIMGAGYAAIVGALVSVPPSIYFAHETIKNFKPNEDQA